MMGKAFAQSAFLHSLGLTLLAMLLKSFNQSCQVSVMQIQHTACLLQHVFCYNMSFGTHERG